MTVPTVPYRIWLGVTGHRDVNDDPRLAAAVEEVLRLTRAEAAAAGIQPVCFGVISALAEGADRLVARAILQDADAVLEVVLPLRAEDYRTDFHSAESQQEFDRLLAQAATLREEPPVDDRAEAYSLVGQRIVERCDVLIAVWDEAPERGRGGTAEVVRRGRRRDPAPVIYCIPPPDCHLYRESGGELEVAPFVGIRRFNEDRPLPSTNRWATQLRSAADSAGLRREALDPVLAWLAPLFERADGLSDFYHRWYQRCGATLFLGAAVGVGVAAAQAMLFPERAELVLVEAVLMLGLLGTVFLVRRLHLHHRWLAYRSLAESCRSSLFLFLTSCAPLSEESTTETAGGTARRSERWVPRAYEEIWLTRPQPVADVDPKALGSFLNQAWVLDQITYQDRAHVRFMERERLLTSLVYLLFCATLAAAILHYTLHLAEVGERWLDALAYASVVLPAFGGAVGGLRAQREFQRNSDRARRMAATLRLLRDRIQDTADAANLRNTAWVVAQRLAEENRDWYDIMVFHDVELHV
jgi:hypothetical protein